MIWSALVLGFAGSLHCLGMCGPLALSVGASQKGYLGLSAINYQLGRIFTYVVLGVIAGLFSELISITGFQQYVSILIGAILIIGVLVHYRFYPGGRLLNFVKQSFTNLLNKQTSARSLLLGIINGLLPCGLVYIALITSLSMGTFAGSLLFMLIFGLGTVPMMFFLTTSGKALFKRISINKIVPYVVVVIGLMFILRGLELGIPMISPFFENNNHH